MRNPYSPPAQASGTPNKQERPETPSIWLRNLKACTAVVIGYSSFAFLLAFSGKTVPETAVPALAGFAGAASAWANIRLGPSIGWSRGGLPIVLITVFAAMIGYMALSLMAAALIFSWLSPTWHFYTP